LCHWNFSFTKFSQLHYGPGVYSASNRNEYQEYFLGVKVAGAWSWQPYHLHVPTVLKSWSLNLLEPSRPVQACNGIVLPFLSVLHQPLNHASVLCNIPIQKCFKKKNHAFVVLISFKWHYKSWQLWVWK